MESGEDPSRINIRTGEALARETHAAADDASREANRAASFEHELPLAARLGRILVEQNVRRRRRHVPRRAAATYRDAPPPRARAAAQARPLGGKAAAAHRARRLPPSAVCKRVVAQHLERVVARRACWCADPCGGPDALVGQERRRRDRQVRISPVRRGVGPPGPRRRGASQSERAAVG
eukprot:4485184-Prymnesium_polylepis.1